MKMFTRPVSLNESSLRIDMLHSALHVLGYPVSEEEQRSHTAGKNTLEQVRALQKQLNIKFDDAHVVDDATYNAIVDEVNKRGLSGSLNTFTVKGTVYDLAGERVKRQKLIAVDADLKGVGIYRIVKTIKEIETSGGFEFLRNGYSDSSGDYYIEFYSFQFANAERKKADVIVYAVTKEGDIIGRSRMVNSEEYSAQGLVTGLDVLITKNEQRTEYDVLMGKLIPFLKESNVALFDLSKSREQVLFISAELDENEGNVRVAVDAGSLSGKELPERAREKNLSHELLYGIGRQNITLSWNMLYKKTTEELRTAIKRSVSETIIKSYDEREIGIFLKNLHDMALDHILRTRDNRASVSLEELLLPALPQKEQQVAFLKAFRSFRENHKEQQIDYKKFWKEYLPQVKEFKDPKLISALLLSQQLTVITGNHIPLISELQLKRRINTAKDLISIDNDTWKEILAKTGVPEFISGDKDKGSEIYRQHIQSLLHEVYPTQKIASMLKKKELTFKDANISSAITQFLERSEKFDFAHSRVDDFEKEIKDSAADHFKPVKKELKRIQRTFQLSTSPEVLGVLLKNNLDSAYSIAGIPKKSFLKMHSEELGGVEIAEAVYQRAEHVNTMAAERTMKIMDVAYSKAPKYSFSESDQKKVMDVLQNKLPNYSELFGSPDICECEHCRSVYSAANYFVDLLRFLWRGAKNADNKTPLHMFEKRRPDLLHLPLTCENTNTVIPYVDLVNEVMEYYTYHGLLDANAAHDTGDTTSDELRASQQNFEPGAYRIIKNAVYPFSLPYHQPLDVIRTYSGHIKTERHDVMKGMQKDFTAAAVKAIEAEALQLSEEEYIVMTGKKFSGSNDTRQLFEYFGYAAASDLEKMAAVPEFLKRSGIKYTDLVELVSTKFINPHQDKLDFLQRLFSGTTMNASTLYTKLQNISAGTLDPATDPSIMNSLTAASVSPADFILWVQDHFNEFNSVITLYESESKCDLDTTSLKRIQNIYSGSASSGIPAGTWSKLHRFIRLWRKLGWKIHETDLILNALGENDITETAVSKLSYAVLLNRQLKLPVNKLATLWGSIDTYGNKSLYKKLFLNKAVQRIDPAFTANKFENFLTDGTRKLAEHMPAVLAAFRMSEDDMSAVLDTAYISDNGVNRKIDPVTDKLEISVLSVLYRYTVLSKALKLKVADFCLLVKLFNAGPFSFLNIPAPAVPPAVPVFSNISPAETFSFYQQANAIKKAGFKAVVLQYILTGTVPPDSSIDLSDEKVRTVARSIRQNFAVIEQEHPEVPSSPVTTEMIRNKLSLSYTTDVINQLIAVTESRSTFDVFTNPGLPVIIPAPLSGKFTYDNADGRITASGIMTDTERTSLKALAGADDDFNTAIDSLYISIGERINGAMQYSIITDPNLVIAIPSDLSLKYSYTKASGRLVSKGVMNDNERTALKALGGANAAFKGAVDKLYSIPEEFIKTNFSSVFTNMNAAIATLLNQPAQPVEATLDEKLQLVYNNYLPLLRQKLREDAITKHIGELLGINEETATILLKNDLQSMIGSVTLQGFSGEYFSNATFIAPSALKQVDKEISFDWLANAPDALVPANNFSVRWQAFLSPPASGEYILVVEVKEPDETFKLFLDDVMILEKSSAINTTSLETNAQLNASQLHKVVVEYSESTGNAGIKLSWKTATTGLEIIPSFAVYPADVMNSFYDLARLYHRSVKFITGFRLDNRELKHFLEFSADFDNINFKALTAQHWKRINDYTRLRNAVPQSQAFLTDIFAAANITNPAPDLNSLTSLLNLATGWDLTTITYLVNSYYGLTANNFKNEVALLKIYDTVLFSLKTGISAETLAKWALPETDFDKLMITANLVKSTVKAKYEEEEWLDLAGDISDKIRENQKQALISYLLTVKSLIDWGVTNADGLYEYFLIDVQMGACMDTSRIVQANSAVQMFVTRCLLNLESDMGSGNERGVSPEAIDRERWEWMKYYRVWEVNRKIFLYPENWLEPEWRDDKSCFFKELESELVQNDITDRSVETAFRNYLGKVNTVANLDICGMYQENYENDNTLKLLHVFGRTHNAPYQFFYRTCDQYWKWSAWDKVQVDVRMYEDGNNSGVHLIPVVWKKRLFIFWTEFIEKQRENSYNKNKNNQESSFKDISEDTPSSIKAIKYWEIRLAWSEYIDNKWSPKQLTKEYISGSKTYNSAPKSYTYHSFIDSADALVISLRDDNDIFLGSFYLSDIQSPLVTNDQKLSGDSHRLANYQNFFMKRRRTSELFFNGNTYLRENINHRILYSSQVRDFEEKMNYPFFYHDKMRTYFVKPVDIKVSDFVKDPWNFAPPFFEIIDDSYITRPHIPEIGPDDLMPGMNYTDPLPYYFSESMGIKNDLNRGIGELPGVGIHRMLSMESRSFEGPVSAVSAMQSKSQVRDVSELGNAFSSTLKGRYEFIFPYSRWEKGLEFYTFYHPWSGKFVTNMNQGGIPGLMSSDTKTNPVTHLLTYNDGGGVFETAYDPNFTSGFVKKAPTTEDYKPGAAYTFYKENVCFDVYGANSIYNWELFFHAPLYIATRLSKNGRYEEAMKWFHYIFDPTTDEMPLTTQSETSRYWKTLPFKTIPSQTLEEWFDTIGLGANSNPGYENPVIGEWRKYPFRPFVVARNRPLAFMKNVVIKYIENLRSWGDSLFRMFTRESVNEALQLYVLANQILGPRPEFVPKRGNIQAETYDSLKTKWDDFSNALVEMENIFPYSSSVPVNGTSSAPGLTGIGPALYFCIPNNEKLLEHWDTVADRLFKIRHCMDIDGVERQLALFAPAIDPAMLINAAAQGLSLGSILSDLSSPPPVYRFNYLLQRAHDFCNEVRSLGSTLLSVLEKKDGEELGRLRSSHETAILELMTGIKERQVLDGKATKSVLLKSRETAAFRLNHFYGLLSEEGLTIPGAPSLDAEVNSESSLPTDTTINEIISDVDDSLVDSGEGGVKIIPKEKEDLDLSEAAKWITSSAGLADGIAGVLRLIPQVDAHGTPLGVGAALGFGGVQVGGVASGVATAMHAVGTYLSMQAATSQKIAGYIRREQDWTLQANLAAKEIIQLDKQITSADIRIQIAEKDLSNHKQQIENAKQVEQFLKDKFTNLELYQWMREQLFSVYKQSYNMAYDMAKKVEKCYRYEIGNEITGFIQYGYWDNTMQGLCAGEKLQLALRQLEKSYLEENKRELELTKSVSVALLNPLALQELRTTGKCLLTVPEELYDLDYAGHYFRRIKSVSVSLPCIAGPFTTVNCTLRLLKNIVRINTSMNENGTYEHNNEEGIRLDDDRFRESNVPVRAIAASNGQRDPGIFQLNFSDERYLPFEGAGAISDWKIELAQDKDLRQFDYSTISDVILHISYTAREDAGLFKASAITHLKEYLSNVAELSTQPLMRMFSLKHEFASEWHKFLYPAAAGDDQLLNIKLKKEHFPFFTKDRSIDVVKIETLIQTNRTGEYKMMISAMDLDDEIMTSGEIPMTEKARYGNMQAALITASTANLNAEELNIFSPLIFKFKHSTDNNFFSIDKDPEEISDMFFVIHYKLGDVIL